jgi:hypothetical protein
MAGCRTIFDGIENLVSGKLRGADHAGVRAAARHDHGQPSPEVSDGTFDRNQGDDMKFA